MYYAICGGVPGSDGLPFLIYGFGKLEDMRHCEHVDERAIVYNGDEPRQLLDFCSLEELKSICASFGETIKFISPEQAASAVHTMTAIKAVTWNPEKENNMSDTATATLSVAPAPEAPILATAKQERPRFNKDARIVCLMDTPPLREGTNRFRNMLVIMQSSSVAEAMKKLRALDPAPGGGVDIKIAIKAGAIKLEE